MPGNNVIRHGECFKGSQDSRHPDISHLIFPASHSSVLSISPLPLLPSLLLSSRLSSSLLLSSPLSSSFLPPSLSRAAHTPKEG